MTTEEPTRYAKYYRDNKAKKDAAHAEWQRLNKDKVKANNAKAAAKKKEQREIDFMLGLLPETPAEIRKRRAKERKDKLEDLYMLGLLDKLPSHMRLTEQEKRRRCDKAKANLKERRRLSSCKRTAEERRIYKRRRIERDPIFKLSRRIRSSIGLHLRNRGYTKKSRTAEIIGIDYAGFKQHIESQFEPWMNWDNYGVYIKGERCKGWDLDHILPLSAAVTEEEIIEFNHYTNLRPLCSYENRVVKKGKLL